MRLNGKIVKYSFLFIGVLLVFFSVRFISGSNQYDNENKFVFYDQEHVFGDPNAPVKIVEYAEVECIYCKRLHPVLLSVVEHYNGHVALVYRHFPLPIHPKSFTEATALECVAELGGNNLFWQYLDLLYDATPSNNDIDLSILPHLAKSVGISEGEFNECLLSERHKHRIQRDIESGFALNVDSVPQLRIVAPNGQIFTFSNTPSYTALQATIDTALKLNP